MIVNSSVGMSMEKQLFDYDDSDLQSVFDYSQTLLNKKFEQVIGLMSNL